MSITRTSAALALSVAIPAIALAAPANAQNVTRVQTGATSVETLPPSALPPLGGVVQNGPTTSMATPTFQEEVTIGPDGVETITRTRFIRRPATTPQTMRPHMAQPIGAHLYPVAPTVVGREQWLAECDRRIANRSDKDKAQIIGGLLGAVGGGILGNVLSDGGLGETLIGAGAGGLAGAGLGGLIGGGKKNGRYDCEAALDGYVAQYGQMGAVRSIPVGYRYAYTGQYGYSSACGCQQPQMTLVPIRTEVRQRVIVRETSSEQLVPGKRIVVPPRPNPSPKMIKTPRPSKLIKR